MTTTEKSKAQLCSHKNTKTVTTSYKLAEHEVHTNIQLFCQKNKSETLC